MSKRRQDMPKTKEAEEVQIVRYFDGPLDKVEVVYNLVCAKMKDRLRGHQDSGNANVPRRQPRRKSGEMPAESPTPSDAV
jgi:hypothetical protein